MWILIGIRLIYNGNSTRLKRLAKAAIQDKGLSSEHQEIMPKSVELGETLEVAGRAEWRNWLRRNHKTAREIWLIYYRKGSGKERIPYNDAVEEALCFGWIDSNVRGVDAERYAQRFSPRNPKTPYSPANQERLRRLIAEGKVAKHVLATLGDLQEPRLELRRAVARAFNEPDADALVAW